MQWADQQRRGDAVICICYGWTAIASGPLSRTWILNPYLAFLSTPLRGRGVLDPPSKLITCHISRNPPAGSGFGAFRLPRPLARCRCFCAAPQDRKQEKLEREKRRQQNEMKNTTYQTVRAGRAICRTFSYE